MAASVASISPVADPSRLAVKDGEHLRMTSAYIAIRLRHASEPGNEGSWDFE
jgi:hypothetical protein